MGFLLGDFKTAWTAVLTSMILSDCQLHFGCRSLEDKKEGESSANTSLNWYNMSNMLKYRADIIIVRERSNILVYIVRILLCVTHWFATESIFLFQGKPASIFTTKHMAWCSRIQHKYTTLPHEWTELKRKVKYNNINERC